MSRRIGVKTIPSVEGREVPIEGNYSTWTQKWKQAYAATEADWNELVSINEAVDRIYIQNIGSLYATRRRLADGSTPTVATNILNTNSFGASLLAQPWSVLRKYFAYIIDEGGVPKLKIFRSGSLVQTIDLSASPTLWTQTTLVYYLSFSPDGKYIFIDNTAANEYALFQGS